MPARHRRDQRRGGDGLPLFEKDPLPEFDRGAAQGGRCGLHAQEIVEPCRREKVDLERTHGEDDARACGKVLMGESAPAQPFSAPALEEAQIGGVSERLIVCRNHALAAERARKREDLLQATERDLARIAAAVRRMRQPLTGKAEIGMAVGAVIGKHNMAKHFALEIADTTFAFARKTAAIAAEAALDGLYAVRTSLPATALDDSATVKSYKSLARSSTRSVR